MHQWTLPKNELIISISHTIYSYLYTCVRMYFGHHVGMLTATSTITHRIIRQQTAGSEIRIAITTTPDT